jgi:hypothetical protein
MVVFSLPVVFIVSGKCYFQIDLIARCQRKCLRIDRPAVKLKPFRDLDLLGGTSCRTSGVSFGQQVAS